jgi:hypothetical protein
MPRNHGRRAIKYRIDNLFRQPRFQLNSNQHLRTASAVVLLSPGLKTGVNLGR